jgi:hypothetical protein
MKIRGIAYDSGVELSSLPPGFRNKFSTFLRHWLPGSLILPDAEQLVSVVLLYQGGMEAAPRTVTVSPAPGVSSGDRFGTDWQVMLERVRDLPRPGTREPIGRLTIASRPNGWSKIVGLTLPRFICAEAMVKKGQGALRSGEADLGPENVLCDMDWYEWAFQEFGERHQNALRGVRDISFEEIFGKHLRDYLFRLKELLRKRGVDAILGGAFPTGYFIDTHPANITYIESVQHRSTKAP